LDILVNGLTTNIAAKYILMAVFSNILGERRCF